MEDVKVDVKKKYPSLPRNYVSFAQLQERWIQQQQQKQKEQEQKEEVASENQQQPKERKGFNRNGQGSKNGEGRIHAQGVRVRQNGERRVDAHRAYVPRRQSDGNDREIWEAKSEMKLEKLELRASGDGGGNGTGNAMYKKKKKYNRKKRKPRVKEGLNGEHPIQTLSENGGMSGVLNGKNGGKEEYPENVERNGHEKGRVQDIVSVCMVGLVPEIKGKAVIPVGSSRKSRGKQGVNDQFSSSEDGRRVEGKTGEEEAVDGQFVSNTDDRGFEGSLNEYMVEVLPENGSEEKVSAVLRRKNGRRYNAQFERSGNNKGLAEEGNVCTLEVLQDNEAEGDVPGDERRKTGKERFRSGFQGNEGNWRMKRNSNNNKGQLEVSQQPLEERVFMGQKERNGPKARTDRGVRGYGNKDRVSDNPGSKIIRYFGDLSLNDSRKGNSSGGQRESYGNLGRFPPGRKGKLADGGLVWVKKEEISDTNPAEIS